MFVPDRFSRGPQLVSPVLTGLETVLMLPDAARIRSEQATWAVCEGNPVRLVVEFAVAAAQRETKEVR